MVAVVAFTLLPAVDVSNGRAARLGDADPVAVALEMQRAGAEWIHLVDLDAAFDRGSNAALLESVIAALDIPVELAGGVASSAALDWALATECDRVVLASDALHDPAWCTQTIAEHGDRLAVSLDVRVDRSRAGDQRYVIAPRGASADGLSNGLELESTIDWLDDAGCATYIVTDVNRDGALSGPNIELCRSVGARTTSSVVASGGVSTIDDLVAVSAAGLDGCIVGSALWSGAFELGDALAAVRSKR